MADSNVTLTLAMRDEDFKKKIESIKENIRNIRVNKENQINEINDEIDEVLDNTKKIHNLALLDNTNKLSRVIDKISKKTNNYIEEIWDESKEMAKNIVIDKTYSSINNLRKDIGDFSRMKGGSKKFKIKYIII